MAGTSRDFENMQVWQKSHHLTLLIYETTRAFPTDERFGLVSRRDQMLQGAADARG